MIGFECGVTAYPRQQFEGLLAISSCADITTGRGDLGADKFSMPFPLQSAARQDDTGMLPVCVAVIALSTLRQDQHGPLGVGIDDASLPARLIQPPLGACAQVSGAEGSDDATNLGQIIEEASPLPIIVVELLADVRGALHRL